MPYIKQKDRQRFYGVLDAFCVAINKTGEVSTGDLNFILTSIIDNHVQDQSLNYTSLNDVIGVLECVKLELYRRLAAPYEDRKLKENGDVYFIPYSDRKKG